MLKKRLTALVCAGAMTIGMIGISANISVNNAFAIDEIVRTTSELEEMLSDYTEIDTHGAYSGWIEKLYCNNANKDRLLNVIVEAAYADFYLKDDLSYDDFSAIVKKINPRYRVFIIGGLNCDELGIKIVYRTLFDSNLSTADLKEISNAVNEKAEMTKAEYHDSVYSVQEGFSGMLNYHNDFGESKILSDYVEKQNLDFTVNSYIASSEDSMCELVPNTELTPQEKFDMAYRIDKELGLSIVMAFPEDTGSRYGGSVVEFVGNTEGDANNDRDCTIADAVAILQYLANSSKYPLSAQGGFNADFDGDGITGADALTIQKMDAKK